jgi:hypothetical protein
VKYYKITTWSDGLEIEGECEQASHGMCFGCRFPLADANEIAIDVQAIRSTRHAIEWTPRCGVPLLRKDLFDLFKAHGAESAVGSKLTVRGQENRDYVAYWPRQHVFAYDDRWVAPEACRSCQRPSSMAAGGRLYVVAGTLTGSGVFGYFSNWFLIVSEDIKQEMVAQKMRGVDYQILDLVEKVRPLTPWWDLPQQ